MGESGDGILAGMKQFKFMRACFGMTVCFGIGIGVSLLTRPEPLDRQRGLVWGTIKDALKKFKGSDGAEGHSQKGLATVKLGDEDKYVEHSANLPVVSLSQSLADNLEIKVNDLLYVSDQRWWLGGFFSAQCVVGKITSNESDEPVIELGPKLYDTVVSSKRKDLPVVVERLY